MATLLPDAMMDPPAKLARNFSYIPKPPPPTPAAGVINSPLELGPLAIPNEASVSLPNINESVTITTNDQITARILNQSTGKPAAGLRASLSSSGSLTGNGSKQSFTTFSGMTDSNGRISDWYAEGDSMSTLLGESSKSGWTLTLESEDYWQIVGKQTNLPEVVIKFNIDTGDKIGGHHISVLLAQWGFTAQVESS